MSAINLTSQKVTVFSKLLMLTIFREKCQSLIISLHISYNLFVNKTFSSWMFSGIGSRHLKHDSQEEKADRDTSTSSGIFSFVTSVDFSYSDRFISHTVHTNFLIQLESDAYLYW